MNLSIQKKDENTLTRLRRLGYSPYINKQGVASFTRRLQGTQFPRMHLYITKDTQTVLECTLHLDQTALVYSYGKVHRGDYDSTPVQLEVERLEK